MTYTLTAAQYEQLKALKASICDACFMGEQWEVDTITALVQDIDYTTRCDQLLAVFQHAPDTPALKMRSVD